MGIRKRKNGVLDAFPLIHMESPIVQVGNGICFYYVDYMFHVAIYRSLAPSEGVAMNVLSTQEDIAYLKDHHVLPSNRFI